MVRLTYLKKIIFFFESLPRFLRIFYHEIQLILREKSQFENVNHLEHVA